jgi:hypothetical protein
MIYLSKSRFIVFGFASFSLALAGCSGSTIHKRSSLGDVQTLSLDAKQRVILTGHNEHGNSIVCAEPSPDALVAQAAVLSANGAYKAGPAEAPSASGGVGVAVQESAASIGHRTQSIQILRDGYYRLCESYLNGAISKGEYKRVVSNLDTFIVVALAVDGLGNSKSAPNVSIGAGKVEYNLASGGAGDAPTTSEASITTPPGVALPADTSGKDTKETAASVAEIVRYYLEYKAAQLEYCTRRGVNCDGK